MDEFQDMFYDQNIQRSQKFGDESASVPLPPKRTEDLFLSQAFRPSPSSTNSGYQGLPNFKEKTDPLTHVNKLAIGKFSSPSPYRDKNALIGIVQPTNVSRNPTAEANSGGYVTDTSARSLMYVDTPQCLDISRKSPGGSGAGILKLRPVAEIPEDYQNIFPFPYFNAVQSKAFDDVLYTDRPAVVCAPTGSGKTVLFELAIIRLLMTHNAALSSTCKIVYMAPIKALCTERFSDWQNKFTPLGLKCMELTGDTELDDYFELQAVNIIFTTPEKWDSMTRRWRDNKSFVRMVRLFLIDEVHMLNDSSRGATMEAVVSRMKTVNAVFRTESAALENGMKCHIRFVAVSATIPNASDVGAWLGTDKLEAACHRLDDSHRPVRLRKVVLGFPCSDSQSEFRFDLSLNYKLAGIIETYSEQKPTLVFCATRKGVQQAAVTLVKDARFVMSSQHRAKLIQVANSLRETKLRESVVHGVAYHHAGLDIQDRKSVEALFKAGELPVLISTSTLAMGVNLPAHLVIIKSTQHYVMGSYQEYSETAVLQMIGRAGRPQFDTSSTAVIMTRSSTKLKYEYLVNGAQLIESSLHQNLMEHLNAEVVLGTIKDVSVAVEWLKSTFLYIRIMKNPKHYGLSAGMSSSLIEQNLQDLCLKNLNALAEVKLIQMEDDGFGLRPTETGRLMARYCIAFETMKKLQAVSGEEAIADLLTTLCSSKEFEDIQLRNNEKRTLNTLNKDKNRATIRYPMEGKIKTNEMKVNCLIQATLGCLSVQDFALSSDTNKIIRSAIRISKCLVEILWHKMCYKALLSAVLLGKCIRAKLWENSKHISRQLPGIGDKLANMLVNAGVSTFQKLEETNPREIELIVNRHPPFGNQVRDSVLHLPKYELYIDQISIYSERSAEITISITMVNANSVLQKSTAGPNHTCILLIGDSDNNVIFKARVSDAVLMKGETWSKKIEVSRGKKSEELNVHFISQDYVGLDVYSTYTPFYIGPKRVTSSPKDQTSYQANETISKAKMPGMTSSAVAPKLEPGRRQCSHHCSNKSMCAHDCCKNGVAVRSKATALDNYRRDLKHRTSVIPEKPCTKRFKPDLTQYRYTPSSVPQLSHGPSLKAAVHPRMDGAKDGRNPCLDMSLSAGNDWGDIELHRQRTSASKGWDDEGDIGDETLLILSPDGGNFHRMHDYVYDERYPGNLYIAEDFQTDDSTNENYLPDILPPSYTEKTVVPRPGMTCRGTEEEVIIVDEDGESNLTSTCGKTCPPQSFGQGGGLCQQTKSLTEMKGLTCKPSYLNLAEQKSERSCYQKEFISDLSDDSDFEELMRDSMDTLQYSSNNSKKETPGESSMTCFTRTRTAYTDEQRSIPENVYEHSKGNQIQNQLSRETDIPTKASLVQFAESGSFCLGGEWESDDNDCIFVPQSTVNTTNAVEKHIQGLHAREKAPAQNNFWDRVFSHPEKKQIPNKRPEEVKSSNRDIHEDIFAGIF